MKLAYRSAGGGGDSGALLRAHEFVLQTHGQVIQFTEQLLWEPTIPAVAAGETLILTLTLDYAFNTSDGFVEFDIAQAGVPIGRPMPDSVRVEGNERSSVGETFAFTPAAPGNQTLQIRTTNDSGATLSSVQGTLVVLVVRSTDFTSTAVPPEP